MYMRAFEQYFEVVALEMLRRRVEDRGLMDEKKEADFSAL